MYPNFKPEPFNEAEGLLESDTTPLCPQHYTETYIVSTLLDYSASESLTTTPLGADTAGKQGTTKWDKTNGHSNTVSQDTG